MGDKNSMISRGLAVRAEGICKLYHIGPHERYSALRDTLARLVRAPWILLKREKKERFWALKDIDLEVEHGEVLGLIGANGAGKSTLLKILSQISRPTLGWAEIYGRVGSLLEVGTGFHPELSGRDNIFLSGAILGMTKREIKARFDEIVAFAEIEKFLDMQVKHYSSGMYVRLAFAVAAHLEPEILLVDEVLAVGDMKFQKKCLGKMSDVAKAGRTVILVTHQLSQIRRLCHRVMWIDGGRQRMLGKAKDVVNSYEVAMRSSDQQPTLGTRFFGKARFTGWCVVGAPPDMDFSISSLDPVMVRFFLEVREPIRRGHHGITLYNMDRQIVWGWAAEGLDLEPGTHIFEYGFPMLPLKPGIYTWMLSIWENQDPIDIADLAPELNVATESYQHHRDEWSGILNLPSTFRVQQSEHIQNSR